MPAAASRLRPTGPMIAAVLASLAAVAAAALLWANYGGRIYVDAMLAAIAGCF